MAEGGFNMATSSIFHNIVITDPKKADAFVAAIEASIADPYVRPADAPPTHLVTDPTEIARLMKLRHKKEGAKR